MKHKTVFTFIFCLLILFSCKTNRKIVNEEILASNSFDKTNYYEYFSNNVFHYTNSEQQIKSFKPILLTNVKPIGNSQNLPERIFALRQNNDSRQTRNYFYNDLKGKVVSYIKNNNEIIFRDYYQDYTTENTSEKKINKPKNITELIDYFKSKNLKYRIVRNVDPLANIPDSIDEQKKALIKSTITSKTYDVLINDKQLYRITLDSNFCKSQLYYKQSDTINDFPRIVTDFFR
ncbi:hypothetical protein CMU79_07150 [Elizabethkingia anophelis]|nr:hypothetical protein [Elizabethkingia anophelis]MDV3618376.1 hypothetical protein [Elizabethkingia anophelis]